MEPPLDLPLTFSDNLHCKEWFGILKITYICHQNCNCDVVLRDDARLVPCDSHLWAMQSMWSTPTIEIPPYKDPCHCKNWFVTLTHCGFPKFTLVSENQGRQKHLGFGQAKYSGGVIPLCWTGKWTGMVEWNMEWNMEWTMEFTFFIAIPNSTV